jgi:hypothetical protein
MIDSRTGISPLKTPKNNHRTIFTSAAGLTICARLVLYIIYIMLF